MKTVQWKRARRRMLAIASALLCAASGASAQAVDSFPSRPLTIIVPFSPGGGTDFTARLLAKGIGDRLGQPVVVDFKPGANTMIGGALVANSKPDGHTLLLTAHITTILNPMLYSKPPFDAEKELDTLAVIADIPLIMSVLSTSPLKNLTYFVGMAKANPGKLTYGTIGSVGTTRLAAAMLETRAGLKFTDVPYKGSSVASADFLGGQLDFLIDAASTALPLVTSGRARALAVSTKQRLPQLPDVPTLDETYPGLVAMGWYSLTAPTGLPASVESAAETRDRRDPRASRIPGRLGRAGAFGA